MDARRDERSLGDLFGDLSRQLSTLIRKEIDLARTEMTNRARSATQDAALIGAGGALAYAGVLVFLGAVVLLLVDAGLEPWLAALLVAVVAIAIGGALVWRGREGLKQTSLTPERTIETLKDDAEWAKEQIK
jgi:VIT1/CCC1 family predicted Fe2+/Mn2+ transporter